jgi:hypothetical protein
MEMQAARKAVLLFPLLVTASAHADIFMCKDAGGRTFTSDRPIPECADRAVREYRNNGALKKEIAAPLTAQQKRELAAQQEKQKADQAAADEKKREDRALRARYRSEGDIEAARRRETETFAEQTAQQKKTLAAAESELKAAQMTDAAQKQTGKPSPASKTRLANAGQDVLEAKTALQDTQAGLARVNEKYDRILNRYREITGTLASE